MIMRRSIVLGLILVAVGGVACGQNDTFTQVGSVACKWQYQPSRWGCPAVTFPREFGGLPSVVVSFSTFFEAGPPQQGFGYGQLYNLANIAPAGVTTTGFTPTLSSQMNSLGLASINIVVSWVAVGPILLHGTALPKYLVLTVIYAPPGTNGGHSTSSVSYQAGSTTGTTTSASQSFKTANSLSFEASGGFLGNGGGSGVSFDWSRSSTDSQSLEIKKSTTATINQPGPAQDGLNHDEDEIWLLLNPTVNLALSSSSAAWVFANTPSLIQYVHIGWLNGHQTMPPGVAAALQSGGITSQDYPAILARDPLASGPSSLDPNRYVPLNTTFPYEPPYSPSDPVPTVTFNVSDSSTATTGSAIEETYKVGLNMSATGNYLDFAKATLKDTASWEWTNKSSLSSATGTSQSASVTVGGPAYGYTGGTVMQVFMDTMYKTFAFAIVPITGEEISVDGALVNSSGAPLPNTEVTLKDNGAKYRTFTNSKGEYKFVGHIAGPASIEAIGITQQVPQQLTTRHVMLRKP